VKPERNGFTLVELLICLVIVSVDLALLAFKNDQGYYPPSSGQLTGSGLGDEADEYCGAQKLAEALVGWDLMGFHPGSNWMALVTNNTVYDLGVLTDEQIEENLKNRKGPYLDPAMANAFKLDGLFEDTKTLEGDTFVLCDVFGYKKVRKAGSIVKAGAPILYYKANTASKRMKNESQPEEQIYNIEDNWTLIEVKRIDDDVVADANSDPLMDEGFFYEYGYIIDKNASAAFGGGSFKWPYRPDSYLLISAGHDGRYGTDDDIKNF
jgi:prepilin-type N-terminal cleavage/methylation domain-containing protein